MADEVLGRADVGGLLDEMGREGSCARAEVPVDGFSATASFEATNLKGDLLDALCVFTEVTVEGLPEQLQETRRSP